MTSKELLQKILSSLEDVKANQVVVIDLAGKSSLSDYLVICHGTSTTHSNGLAERVDLNLKKDKILPLGVEGREQAEWILMDYNDVIVHIFLESTRNLYRIEDLYPEGLNTRKEG